jgi:hypothetical protein
MRHGGALVAVAVVGIGSTAARAEPVAPAAPAAKADAPAGPLVLSSVERVRDLCLALRPGDRVLFAGDEAAKTKARAAHEASRQAALGGLYRARLPTASFRFSGFNERDGRLGVDLSRPLRTLRGAVTLTSRLAEVGFPMTLEAAGAVPGFTQLDVTFTLDAADPGCAGSVGVGKFRLGVVPAALDLLDRDGKPIAHVDLPPTAAAAP